MNWVSQPFRGMPICVILLLQRLSYVVVTAFFPLLLLSLFSVGAGGFRVAFVVGV